MESCILRPRIALCIALLSSSAWAQAVAPPLGPNGEPLQGCYPGKQGGEDVLFCPRPVAIEAPAPSHATEWYGWQTLLVDGASLVLSVGAASTRSGATAGTLGLASLAGYLFGGPLVHVGNGRALTGLGSLGLRTGLPVGGAIAGGLAGYGSCGKSSGDFGSGLCVVAFGFLGAGVGLIAAVITDAAWLARKTVETRQQQGVRWLPDLSLTPTGGSAGVRGAF